MSLGGSDVAGFLCAATLSLRDSGNGGCRRRAMLGLSGRSEDWCVTDLCISIHNARNTIYIYALRMAM